MPTELFHWVIFGLHLAAALLITFGVWFRCSPDLWAVHARADTYSRELGRGSPGLWLQPDDDELWAACSAPGELPLRCYQHDLPLYNYNPPRLGWNLFGLLGHFEWISASYAFFYIEGQRWASSAWVVSAAMAAVGTLLFLPLRGEQVFWNQTLLQVLAGAGSALVFYSHRGIHAAPTQGGEENTPLVSKGRWQIPRGWPLRGAGSLQTGSYRLATLPALRYMEYCATASELFVAVLALFVRDAPIFLSLGGYLLIFLTNLYGLLLHYSLVADHATTRLGCPACTALPRSLQMAPVAAMRGRPLVVPRAWLGPEASTNTDPEPVAVPIDASEAGRWGWGGLANFFTRQYAWGSFIASNTSTLLNSWMAFLAAISLVFYQQTFLFSPDPPAYVVFAGWSLLVTYSSFGIWFTLVYTYPEWWARRTSLLWLCGGGAQETYVLIVRGLDVLSVAAKLSIVGAMSYGFVFAADGQC